MKFLFKKLNLETKKQFELVDITGHVRQVVMDSRVATGLAVVFSPHTTASIKINHNESLLLQDFMKGIYRLIPIDISYSHDLFEVRQNVAPNERSNGHAHVKAFFLGNSESIPIEKSDLTLGSKQSVFFVELDGGRAREIHITVLGD